MAQTKIIINQRPDGSWLVWDQLETYTSRSHEFDDRAEVLEHLTWILTAPEADKR